jgi:integrase
MKRRKEHRVPLAAAVIAILERTPQEHRHGPVFPGAKPSKPISVISLWRRANAVAAVAVPAAAVTSHGLRSSFRDWAAEQTSFPDEVAEQALAHSVGSKVRRSYQRGDLLAKRRQLMEAWARYCASAPSAAASADVVPLRGPRRG